MDTMKHERHSELRLLCLTSGHCEWPGAVSGRATRQEAKGGTRRRRDTAFARCVWNGHWVRCGRGGLVFLALARSAARRLGDSAAWRLVGSPAVTGPVGETPKPESRRSAQSDHQAELGV